MNDYKEMIQQLEQQNMNPDLPSSQREANKHRIFWLTLLNRDKPTYHPSNGTDFLLESIKDSNNRCTPASLLQG